MTLIDEVKADLAKMTSRLLLADTKASEPCQGGCALPYCSYRLMHAGCFRDAD